MVLRVSRRTRIKVGGLGSISFPAGHYVYVGSALGRGSSGLQDRIGRHLKKDKHLRWHIDFLLNAREVAVVAAVYSETRSPAECALSKALCGRSDIVAKGFGSSDCKAGCPSHLHYFAGASPEEVLAILEEAYYGLGLRSEIGRYIK